MFTTRNHTRALAVGATALALTLAGCSASTSSPNNSGSKVGFTTASLGDPYRVAQTRFLQNDATDNKLNLQQAVDANNDPAKQITDVQTMLGQGVKGVLMVVVDSKAIGPALAAAKAKRVPVVVVDNLPATGSFSMGVAGNQVYMGQQACKMLGDSLKGKGKVLELQGDLSGETGRQRSAGFESCMKQEFPGISVIAKPTDFIQEKATTAAQTVLSTDPTVNGVFCASDSAMLPGVVTVLKRLGKLEPATSDKHVSVVTIDGSGYALDQVRAGYVDGIVSQPLSDYARWATYYMAQILAGKKFKPGPTDHDSTIVSVGGNLIDQLKSVNVTSKNVDDPKLWANAK